MQPFDITAFAAPGVDLKGLDPRFADALSRLIQAAPKGLKINSGFRSPEKQAALYAAALKKYGSEKAARKWVAPPGKSNHNHGHAADLGFASPALKQWVHDNAANFGLAFPMAHEPWHIELADRRSGGHAGHDHGAQVEANAAPAALPVKSPPEEITFASAPPVGGSSFGNLLFSDFSLSQRRGDEQSPRIFRGQLDASLLGPMLI